MKKVLAIACLLVILTMAVAVMATAQVTTQGNWRVYFKAADTSGLNSLGDMTLGVNSVSKDGFGVDGVASDSQDTRAALTQAPARAVVGVFDNKAWIKDVKSNRLPENTAYAAYQSKKPGFDVKPWFLRIAGLGSASASNTVLTIRFVSTAAGLPPVGPINTKPITYALKMVDNKGIAGAPASGTVWAITIPTWQSTAFFSLTLPTFNISVPTNEAALINEGYQMEFYQMTPVPEPSSLLALGAGLMGLAGFASRKRRS